MITMHSDSMKEIAAALSKFQNEILNIKSESENPFFKSKYADLASVWNSVRAPLTSNGLSLAQMFLYEDGKQFLVTQLTHLSGEFLRSIVLFAPTKNDPQALGSYSSYLRRYSMNAILGLAQYDDDAESTMERNLIPPSMIQANLEIPKHVGGTNFPQDTFPEDHKKFPGKKFDEVLRTQDGIGFAMWAKKQLEMGNQKLPQYVLRFHEAAKPYLAAEFGK